MPQVVGSNQVKLDDGKIVQAQQGGWYNGAQYWNGTLSAPGVINSQSNQQGAGQAVSKEVVAQTNPANVDYLAKQNPSLPYANAQPQNMPGNTGAGNAGGGTGVGFTPPETINLPQLYEGLYSKSGIRDIEAGLSSKTNTYNEQVAKIKDNPYLSEATMSGRIKKLDDKYRADTQLTQNDITMRKADIETQLNLQTKQFDINSQATKQAWDQFNTLLSSGALANASGEDIANITRSTGISSSMIQSAVKAASDKNNPVNVIQSTDSAGNLTLLAVDSKGNVVNQQTISGVGKSSGGSGGEAKFGSSEYKASSASALDTFVQKKANSYGHLSPADWGAALSAYISDGLGDKKSFVSNYQSYADPNRGDFSKAYGFAKP